MIIILIIVCDQLLMKLRQRHALGVQSIKLLHDNGKPHIHEDVVSYVQSEGVTVMSHPPNSPTLSPCDF